MVAPRRLRDPLRSMPVKSKLTLLFAGVCLMAFGVGGTLAWGTAEDALEEAMFERLDLCARSWARTLEADLDTLVRRAEDFASDGHIRALAEQLLGEPDEDRRGQVALELGRHLERNKLPLEHAFVDLTVLGPEGRVLHAAHDRPNAALALEAARADTPWVGPFDVCLDGDRGPRLALATPVVSLEGERELGRLLVWVNVGTWLVRAIADERGTAEGLGLRLIDPEGRVLAVPSSWLLPDSPAPTSEVVRRGFGLALTTAGSSSPTRGLTRRFPLSQSGLRLEVDLDPGPELAAIAGLQSRFVVVGALLALLTALLLYFPIRFLARPLSELKNAARRLREGDRSVRVVVDSEDEIGTLGEAFNQMAAAIEERTDHLERTAADLLMERRAANEERDRLDAVISSMRDGLVVLDEEGRVVLANEAAAPLRRLIQQGATKALTTRNRCEAHEGGEECEACLLGPDRGARSCVVEHGGTTFEVHATRLGSSQPGAAAGRVLVSHDVSDRIVQDERQIHQERLAVLGEVSAVFAHELNNPLAAIRMYNQLLEAGLAEDSQLREHAAVVARNTEACSRTIRELLDYAYGAAPEIGLVSVHDMLEDVTSFLQPLAERASVELSLEPAAEESDVTGDEIQLRQIFVNLVMNAIQASTGEGRVTLRTVSKDTHLVVEVEDDGPGIPEEQRERVFRPFYTTKLRGEGTGLGLPTARRIAELQGGGVELVDTRPGCTRFRVRLRRTEGVPA